MVVGAIVAAYGDLTFDLEGYVLATLNNFFTAANGVISKQKMEEKEIGTFGFEFNIAKKQEGDPILSNLFSFFPKGSCFTTPSWDFQFCS